MPIVMNVMCKHNVPLTRANTIPNHIYHNVWSVLYVQLKIDSAVNQPIAVEYFELY